MNSRRLFAASLIALFVVPSSALLACTVPLPAAEQADVEHPPADRFGLWGVMMKRDAEKYEGREVALVGVLSDYQDRLPATIRIVDGPCCKCVYFRAEVGERFFAIVEAAADGRYQLVR